MKRLWKFFVSVKDEMKLVTWPTGKELRKDSTTVIGTVLFYAVFFAVVDFGITKLLALIITK